MHRMRYDIVQRTTLSGKMDDVPNKSENDAMFSGNRLGGKFVSKNVVKLPRKISLQWKFPFYQKDLNLFLLQPKLIKQS